jgi:hypothetical protein
MIKNAKPSIRNPEWLSSSPVGFADHGSIALGSDLSIDTSNNRSNIHLGIKNAEPTPSSYFLLGGYDGLKSLLTVSKKLTGTKMPLVSRVNAKACSTS